ncbi:hypothetical protein ES708_04187 [subsurface metagenome]
MCFLPAFAILQSMKPIPDWVLREIDKLMIDGFGELLLTIHDHKITKLKSTTYRRVQGPEEEEIEPPG